MKIAVLVTARTGQFSVLSLQREFRATVIELRARVAVLPARRVMTTLARALELGVAKSAPVRILMTGLTAAMREALEQQRSWCGIRRLALGRRSCRVTLLATNRLMLAC